MINHKLSQIFKAGEFTFKYFNGARKLKKIRISLHGGVKSKTEHGSLHDGLQDVQLGF